MVDGDDAQGRVLQSLDGDSGLVEGGSHGVDRDLGKRIVSIG